MKKYTVKEVADISGVTIKTLYHYQKIGLLEPYEIAVNGYRYYTDVELKKLQEIIVYRKLDFSLEKINELLNKKLTRLAILEEQEKLLEQKSKQYKTIRKNIKTLIKAEKSGKMLSPESLFRGTNMQEQYYDMTNKSKMSIGIMILFAFFGITTQMVNLNIFSTRANTNNQTFWKYPVIISFCGITILIIANVVMKYLKKYYINNDAHYKNDALAKLINHRYTKIVFFFDNEFKGSISEATIFGELTDTTINFYHPIIFNEIFPRNPFIKIIYEDIASIKLKSTNTNDNRFPISENQKQLLDITRKNSYEVMIIDIRLNDRTEYKLLTNFLPITKKFLEICNDENINIILEEEKYSNHDKVDLT